MQAAINSYLLQEQLEIVQALERLKGWYKGSDPRALRS
jgi:hypothetical protein